MKVKLLKKLRKKTYKSFYIKKCIGEYCIMERIPLSECTVGKYKDLSSAKKDYLFLWHVVAREYFRNLKTRIAEQKYPW